MPSGRGNPFPASGPFAPADRGKRAEKAACHFADESIIARFGVVEVCGSGPMKKATISGSSLVGLFMDTWHIFDG